MPDDQQGESILKKYGFNPPGAGGEASLASPTPVAVPPEETGGILQKYGFKPPAPTQEVKPPVAPAQPPQIPKPAGEAIVPTTPETVPKVPGGPENVPAEAKSVPKEPETVPGGFGGEVKKIGGLPEALAPTRQPAAGPEELSLLSEIGTGAKLGLVDLAQRAARSIDPSIGMGGMEVPPPEERAKAGGDRLLKELFPQGVPKPAGMAGEVVRGLSESWPALLALGALAPVGSIPAFAAWGLTEEKPVEGAVKGAVLGGTLAGLGKVTAPIVNPVARWLTKIAGGAAIGGGATALQGGGPEEISRDALIFGLFETWGLARSGEWRGFLKDKGVPEADLKTIDEKKVDSPEFVGAVNEAAAKVVEKSMFDKTPQPEAPTPEAQKEAIFGGDVKDIIDSKENRADAIQALVPKIGDQARAEQFYDLYQKGDAATALKEFPELASWATEQQKGAQKGPEGSGPEKPVTPDQPMSTAGGATEAIVAKPPLETSPEADSKAAATADMVTSPGNAVAPGGRSNTTEPPPEAAPAPPRVPPPPPEPPSSAPAQAGGGGTVGLSATPAGEKPKPAPEPTTPAAPMGTAGGTAENLVSTPTITPEEIVKPGAAGEAGAEGKAPVEAAGTNKFTAWRDKLKKEVTPIKPEQLTEDQFINGSGFLDKYDTLMERVHKEVPGLEYNDPSFTGWPEWAKQEMVALEKENIQINDARDKAHGELKKILSQKYPDEARGIQAGTTVVQLDKDAYRLLNEPGDTLPEALAPTPDPLQAAKDFKKKFGSRQGAPDVGMAKDDYGGENEDRRQILKDFGKFDSRADILKNFTQEERRLLFPYTKRGAQSPDALLSEVKGIYPHLFGEFETDADLLRAIINGKLKPTNYAKIEEAHNAVIEREAAENGLDAAALAQAEADVEREVAAERDAIQNEPRAGEPLDLESGWDASTAFGLSPREKPASKLNARLDELAAEYPDIDREKAATVLRSLPNADNGQIANMSADPEMFSQVARGNLAATEKAQLLKNATDAGAQQGLPGMGGEDRLFKAGEEAAFTRGLTTEQIQGRLGKGGTVSELSSETFPADSPYARGWTMRLKNGQMAMVFEAKDGSLTMGPHDILGPDYSALGITDIQGKTIAGSFKPVSFGSLIELARGQGLRTFDHESWHHIEHWLLNDKERAAIIKQFGDNEEVRAEAYANWNPKEAPNTIFQKILDFFQQIVKAFTGKGRGEDVFAAARSGELFGREAVERGLPEALAPGKLRVEEGARPEEREDTNPIRLDANGLIKTSLLKPLGHVNDILTGIQKAIIPGAVSKEHRQAAYDLRPHLGTFKREGFQTVNEFKPIRVAFDKAGINNPTLDLTQTPQWKMASDISTGSPVDAPYRATAEKIVAANADRMRRMQAADVPLDTFRENYFGMAYTPESRRAFNQAVGEAVDAGKGMEAVEGNVGGQTMNLNEWSAPDKAWVKSRTQELMASGQGSDNSAAGYLVKRPMQGRESFTKQKVFDDVMTGMEFGLQPISNNPVDVFLLKALEMDRSIYFHGAIKDFKAKGDVVLNPAGRKVSEGWVKLEGPYGEVRGPYDPEIGGYAVHGNWIAKEQVAELINNSMAQSLYNNPYFGKAFKGFMATGNLMNQFQLLSGFHIGFTGIETQISAGAEVLKDVYGVVRGNRSISDLGGTLKRYPTAMARFAMEGNRTLAEYANPSINIATDAPVGGLPFENPAHKAAFVAKAAEMVGAGFTMDHQFRTHQFDKMIKDWYGDQKIKAALRSPIALSEMAMKPIMNYLVPRQKAGVFGDMVARIREQNPTKTMEQLRPELNEAWNRVDSRLGQVQYDRIFMRDGAKNAMQAIFRAPGWTGGTIGEIGGAQVDAVRYIKEWTSTGKMPGNMPDRVAYTLSLLGTMALANGLMTYAFTGKKPEGMDWFAFRTGDVDSKGRDVRFLMPSYMKDLFAWYEAPGHTAVAKTHPLWSMIGELARNKDYYNTLIRDPESGQGQQMVDMGKYVLRQYIPFGVRGMQQVSEYAKFGEQPGRFIAPQFGIMPAPRAYTNTPAQSVIEEYNTMTRSAYSTKEGAELKHLKSDLMKMARGQDEAGFQEAASQAVAEGKITRQQVKEIVNESQVPAGQTRFYRLPVEWMTRTMESASDYEREQFKPLMLKKLANSKPEILIHNRETLLPLLEDMGFTKLADKIKDLELPEEATQFDLTGLGIEKPGPDMSGMSEVDQEIADLIEKHTDQLGAEKKPKSGLRLPSLSRKESDKKRIDRYFGV